LAAIFGFALLFAAAYAGYWYGTQEISNLKSQSAKPTPVVSQPTPTPESLFKPTTQPTPTLSVKDETVGWWGYSKYFDYLGFALKFKYPKDWSVEESGHSGHPNLLTLFSPDRKSCVRISVSSEGGQNSLDEILRRGATNWDMALGDHTVISSNSLTINGLAAKVRNVEREGRRFKDGVISLAPDKRYPTSRVFSYLDSCSMTESNEFELVMGSFVVE